MSAFTWVKNVLSELEGPLRTTHSGALDSVLKSSIIALSKGYAKLHGAGATSINYSSAENRWCYVFKYVTPHADYLYRTLRKARAKAGQPLFDGGKIRVACIGGGPASDVIGVIRYFAWAGAKEPATSIHFDIYDIELGWEPVIDAVIDGSDNESELDYTYSFKSFDVSDTTAWHSIDFGKYDLITSSFFLSEIKRLKFGTVAGQFWLHVLQNIGSGCVVAMNDNNDERVYGIFDKALSKANSCDVIISDSEEISCSDSFSPVQSIIDRLDHRPKRNGDIAFRVVKKR